MDERRGLEQRVTEAEREIAVLEERITNLRADVETLEKHLDDLDDDMVESKLDRRELKTNWRLTLAVSGLIGTGVMLLLVAIATRSL